MPSAPARLPRPRRESCTPAPAPSGQTARIFSGTRRRRRPLPQQKGRSAQALTRGRGQRRRRCSPAPAARFDRLAVKLLAGQHVPALPASDADGIRSVLAADISCFQIRLVCKHGVRPALPFDLFFHMQPPALSVLSSIMQDAPGKIKRRRRLLPSPALFAFGFISTRR